MKWTAMGNTNAFGNLADGKHIFLTGDFTGANADQVLIYSAQDDNWLLGTIAGGTLSWTIAGTTTTFGDLADGRHLLTVADYTGTGRLQVLFNNADDGNWWLGSFSGASLVWSGVGNTSSFGDLADGRHLYWSAGFSSPAKADVLVYYAGDGSWSLGTIVGGNLQWTAAAPATPFGDLTTAQHLVLACGKQGILYLLDRDNLGKYHGPGYTGAGSNDAVLQALPLQPGKAPTAPGLPKGKDNQPGTWGAPAYYGGLEGQTVYYCGNQGPLTAFRLDGGLVRAQESAQTFWAGATPIVTSQRGSAGTAVVWLLARGNPLKLNAFDGGDVSRRLFEGVAGPWNNPKGAPFLEPTVIEGKAYAVSATQLTVFGL
jgi:hypothetical protein